MSSFARYFYRSWSIRKLCCYGSDQNCFVFSLNTKGCDKLNAFISWIYFICNFNNIGVSIVVPITTNTMAGKSWREMSPIWAPFCATIKATSPLDIIPIPTDNASLFSYLQSFAPKPHPITLDNTAPMSKIKEKVNTMEDIPATSVFIPIPAKKNRSKKHIWYYTYPSHNIISDIR